MSSSSTDSSSASESVRLSVGEWGWVARPEWVPTLREATAIPWLNLRECSVAQLLKENDLRSVWRVTMGERAVIAKVYRRPQGWGKFKLSVTGPGCRREFMAAAWCRDRQLPVVRPIAYGRAARGSLFGPYVYLTEEIAPARSLSSYWLAQCDELGRRSREQDNAIVVAVARMLAELHEAGFCPTDLHAENILMVEGEPLRPILVDLHKARWNIRVHPVFRVSNLADLNQWFQHHAGRTDRLRFLLAYLNITTETLTRKTVRNYVKDVAEVTGWKFETLERKRDKRVWGDNRYFARIVLPNGWTGHVFLQARHPIRGSRCSNLKLTPLDWAAALEPLYQSGSLPNELTFGSQRIQIRIERTDDGSETLRDRWQEGHRQVHRGQIGPVPLALLEREQPGKPTERLLILGQEEQA